MNSSGHIELDAAVEMDLEINGENAVLSSILATPLATIPEVMSADEAPPATSSYNMEFIKDEPKSSSRIDDGGEEEDVMTSPPPYKSLQRQQQRLSINMSLLSPSSSCSSSSLMSCSPPSATFSPSSAVSSAMSSPGTGHGSHSMRIGSLNSAGCASPGLNPFHWTSDMRQYIMADIGPQPSNSSQVPVLRNQHFLVRQRSYSKIGPTCAGGSESFFERAQFQHGLLRRSSASDLCTIPQNAALSPILDRSRVTGRGWNHDHNEDF
ncbi:hypothetical protein BG004_007817 [Podila humilis]|nr:hypothetical protein BG004_007817 [Podila humilis]